MQPETTDLKLHILQRARECGYITASSSVSKEEAPHNGTQPLFKRPLCVYQCHCHCLTFIQLTCVYIIAVPTTNSSKRIFLLKRNYCSLRIFFCLKDYYLRIFSLTSMASNKRNKLNLAFKNKRIKKKCLFLQSYK